MCRTAGLVVVVLATLLVAPTAASTISGDPRPSESVGEHMRQILGAFSMVAWVPRNFVD